MDRGDRMADRRALDLDSLAISDRFRLFNFTRRDDHVAYLWVLRAMDRLREVHQVQVDAGEVQAALNELARLHDEVPTFDGNLRDRLDALYEDGVVHRFDDASRAGNLVRYRNRQSVYQFSELGYWAYTSVEGLLAARIQDANLSRLVFSDILEDLKALAAANRAGEGEQVYRRLSRLDSVMEDMGRRSAHFHVTLGEIIRSTDASPETFLRHKNALLTHMSEFMAELDRYLPRLATAVRDVEASGLASLLDRAAAADERPFVDRHERLGDWRRRWSALRAWFAPEGSQESRAGELRNATRIAVSGVIALLRQISEAQRGGVNRATQLRHLAEWVWNAPDEGAAHALMGAAFNLRSARHLGAAHEDAEQISPRATWWDAPGVEVSVTLFRSGKAPTPGVPAPVRGNPGARAALRREQAGQRAAEREAAGHLTDLGAYGRVLDESETRVLLKLMTRALEGRTVVAGRLKRGSGADDAVMIRLVPSDTGSAVRTAQGLLHLPGFRVELAGRTPVTGPGARSGTGSGTRAKAGSKAGSEAGSEAGGGR
ncbi:TIGR02677 family protein [Microbispora bryophytorum]|uniref:TIGR02677 family protein n=1 Tax=Microbispora bryophytorum TaxID=1460882 RepID=UPI0037113235